MAHKGHQKTISKKIRLVIFLIGIIFTLILIAASYIGFKAAQERDANSLNKSTLEIFNTIVRRDSAMLGSNIVSLSAVESLRQDFVAQDREKLYLDAKEIFETNKEKFGITHMYFIGLDGEVFLRVHDKDNFGDTVRRATFLKAQSTQQLASGLELGKTAYALRAVAPYYNREDNIIGYLELGQEIDHFVTDLSSSTGDRYAVVGKKQYLNRADYTLAMSGQDINWDSLNKIVLLSKTKDIVLDGPCLINSDYSLENNEIEYKSVTRGRETFLCSTIPILDADGTYKGALLSKHSYTDSMNSMYLQTLGIALASLAGFTALVFFISHYLNSAIVKPLQSVSQKIKSISDKKSGNQIEYPNDDEIGDVVDSVNIMSKKINDYSEHLETLVEEKTSDLAKFQLAVEGASDHIVITDPNGIVIYANESVHKITGYKPAEVIGKKAGSRELWGGKMPKKIYQEFWETVKVKKKPFTGVFDNVRKNGTPYEAAANVSPILDEKGEVIYFVGIERDVTKEKEVDRAKTEFVSLASHQLRTPLSAINWYAEMLLAGDAGKINKTQKEYLDEIYHGNQRMVELVNSLLNVSRLDLGTFEIAPKSISICEVIEDVAEEMKHVLKEKKQTFTNVCSASNPKVDADPKLMRIIIQNLLSNAVKYTPEKGKIFIDVVYDPKKPKSAYQISVSDTGYGIPESQKEKIFTKLFRADNVRAMDTEGTGLGLYIIKSILDEAGGDISFESKEGKGTTFLVTLPITGMKSKTGNKGIE